MVEVGWIVAPVIGFNSHAHPISLKGNYMIYILLFLIFFLTSKIPLSGFQFLLLLCLIETQTGILIGDAYCTLIFLGYIIFQYSWFKTLNSYRKA